MSKGRLADPPSSFGVPCWIFCRSVSAQGGIVVNAYTSSSKRRSVCRLRRGGLARAQILHPLLQIGPYVDAAAAHHERS